MVDNPIKILYVCDEYPPESPGGFGIFVKEIAHQLSFMGHQVFIYGWYSSVKERSEAMDGPVHVIKDKKIDGLNYLKEINDYGIAITRLARELNVDTVEMTDSGGKFLFVKHHNLCVRLHTSARYFKRRSLKMNLVEKAAFALRRAKIIAVSGFINEKFKGYFKLVNPYSSTEVVCNGINIKQKHFLVDKKRNSIVFGGTLKPSKGLSVLIEAFFQSELWKQGCTLDLYGKDTSYNNESYTSQLKNLIVSKNSEFVNFVKFKGEVSKAELMDKFSESFVNIFPSRYESFGLVVIESMSQGALTIFTNQGAANEIIDHGENGFLFEVDNDKELSDLLTKVIKMNQSKVDDIRKAAQERAAHFSINKCADESMKIYERR